ncbi:MAG TPA: hypothetical protein VK932_30740 [Kofleriaceae bacterium]|nr:hypothetical protein [Kofleriaceae bacterium]
MTDPDDKDYKWLVARERGDDISHVLASERAPYEKLGELLGRPIAPPAGLRQRVLALIDAEERAGSPQPIPEPAAPPLPAPPAPEIVARPAPGAAPPVPEIVARPAPEAPPPRPPVEKKPTEPPKPASRWKRRLGIAAGFAAAAAAVYILWIRPPTPSPDVIALATDIRAGSTVMRGEQASLGDTFIARATTIGPGELRVYGGSAEKMIARCHDGGAGQGGCTVEHHDDRRVYRLELTLERPGYTSAVVFAGPDIPPPSGSRDQDLEAAAKARIKHEPSRRTDVR